MLITKTIAGDRKKMVYIRHFKVFPEWKGNTYEEEKCTKTKNGKKVTGSFGREEGQPKGEGLCFHPFVWNA